MTLMGFACLTAQLCRCLFALIVFRAAEKLKVNPTFTAADEANDRQSLQRKLDQSLYLLVKRTADGSGAEWQFPQGVYDSSEESMRTLAQRSAMACSNDNFYTHMVGNAPFVHTESSDGSKVFYYHSILCSGTVLSDKNEEITDWVWATADELEEYLPPAVFSSVRPVLSLDVEPLTDDLHVFAADVELHDSNAFLGAPKEP